MSSINSMNVDVMVVVDELIKIITDEYVAYGIICEAFTWPKILAECLDELGVNYIIMSGFKNFIEPNGNKCSITHGYMIITGKGIVDIASEVTSRWVPEHKLCQYDLTIRPKYKINDIYHGFYNVDLIRKKQYDWHKVPKEISIQVAKIRELCKQHMRERQS